jgi:Flp pilus assembly protein TadG
MSRIGICRGGVRSRKKALIADQRGAVALEMPFVYAVVIFIMLLPLADLAIAGFRYVSAWEALRAFGQSIQYSPPTDLTNASSWASTALSKADPQYPIPSIQLICGESQATCSAANTATPKYYSYTTTVTLAPIVLKSVLCTSGTGNGCTFTLSYSQRFQ